MVLRYMGADFDLDLPAVREAVEAYCRSSDLEHLAASAGVSRMTLWRLLSGHRAVRLVTLARVLRSLGLEQQEVVHKLS